MAPVSRIAVFATDPFDRSQPEDRIMTATRRQPSAPSASPNPSCLRLCLALKTYSRPSSDVQNDANVGERAERGRARHGGVKSVEPVDRMPSRLR
jgi:hypothetical protein